MLFKSCSESYDKREMHRDYQKLKKVMYSCKDFEQFLVALKYFDLFFVKWPFAKIPKEIREEAYDVMHEVDTKITDEIFGVVRK